MIQFIAAGLAIVGIGATVGAFIYDKLTEEEKREQTKIKKEYESHVAKKQQQLHELLDRKRREFDSLSKQEQDKLNQEIAALQADNRSLREVYLNSVSEQITEHRKRREAAREEISQAITQLREIKKRHHYSLLRKQSLTQLEFTLQESLQKIISYLEYLKKYEKYISFCVKTGKDLPEPFEYLLPNNFPYRGQVILLKKIDVKEHGKFIVNGNITLNYFCADYNLIDEYDNNAEIPLFVEYFDTENYVYILSIAKGAFKNLALFQPNIGLEAKVTLHDQSKKYSDVLLNFKGIRLRLPRTHLDNPLRLPPRGTKLRVFPSSWDYFLRDERDVIVTERYHESLSVVQFQNIPVVINNELINDLDAWMEKNNDWTETDEWKIAPFDEKELPLIKEVKLQLGTSLVLKASMEQFQNYNYLKLEEILSNDQLCKPEDIFVAINTGLYLTLEEELSTIDVSKYEELNQLCLLLTHEFKTQKSIKESHEGIVFYNKWAEVTDKLINYKFKGDAQLCRVVHLKFKENDKRTKRNVYTGNILNVEEVKSFLKGKLYRQYFIETDNGTFPVRFNETGEAITIYGELNIEGSLDILVYEKNIPYPEMQQKNALNSFRQGLVSNTNIKTYVLNAQNVNSSKTEINVEYFYNKYIEANKNQRHILIESLKENEFYMIQGPPGTGKTTVIIEIIQQHLAQHPSDKILVVSQANVAVDNVMKDLITIYGPDIMIRCGKDAKIDSEIRPVSFEQKYAAYIEELEQKKYLYGSDPLFNRWYREVDTDRDYNANLGELILRSHNIIGATCVGLAQKSIGLDRLEFDLVIIDEAGKALPAELLIPINRAKKLILIGDHLQLPPTVDSALFDPEKVEIEDKEYVREELFEKSLFERLFMNCPDTNKGMLITQYRMPAVIGTMISELFYEGSLKNGEITYHKNLHFFKNPLNLLDVGNDRAYRETSISGKSPTNEREAEIVTSVIQKVKAKLGSQIKIAIITPYKGQKRVLQRKLTENGIDTSSGNIAVNTVDAFQGEEAEIVLYCMTRSKSRTNFFSDAARINVALSRTKNELLIIGSVPYMKSYGKNTPIYKVASYVEENGVIVPASEMNEFLEECSIGIDTSLSEQEDNECDMDTLVTVYNPSLDKETLVMSKSTVRNPPLTTNSSEKLFEAKRKRIGVTGKLIEHYNKNAIQDSNCVTTNHSIQEYEESMEDYTEAMEDYAEAMEYLYSDNDYNDNDISSGFSFTIVKDAVTGSSINVRTSKKKY